MRVTPEMRREIDDIVARINRRTGIEPVPVATVAPAEPRRGMVRDVAAIALVALAVGTLAALLILALGAEAPLRDWFALDPEHPRQGVGASTIWLANERPLGAVFLLATVVHVAPLGGLRRADLVTDGIVAVLLGANIILVGLAVGAGGWLVLTHEPWHYACELAALSVASACYLTARRGELRWLVLAGCAVAVGVLLWVGALLEAT